MFFKGQIDYICPKLCSMLSLNVKDETSPLKSVVLGIAKSSGGTPTAEEAYDPKSLRHIKAGTYPEEEDMIKEMQAVAEVLEKHGVKVYRPELIEDYNQIFSRDIGFVIEDVFIKANILPDRDQELEAIQYLIKKMNPEKVVKFPEEIRVEGGDVMPYHNHIFVGTYTENDFEEYITARTNPQAVKALQKLFPDKKVKAFSLRKSNTDPKNNALHLDCCFQPVGKNKAVIYKDGFLKEEEYNWLINFFGKENVFEISQQEMYEMYSNFFSISEEIVISDKSFTRLNNWLREQGITVEEVSYSEIGKQGGLLRCSTLPLERE